jgi:cell division protein FtsW
MASAHRLRVPALSLQGAGAVREPLAGLPQRPVIVRSTHVDGWLLGVSVTLAIVGLLLIFDVGYFLGQDRYADAYALVRRQGTFLLLGALGALVLVRLPSDLLRRLAYPALALAIVLLALVLIPGIGQAGGGAQRWLGVGGFAFQPSELLKPAFVLYLAHSLSRKQAKITSFTYGILPHLITAGVPMILLLAEPDFGGTVLIACLTGAMLFVAGARPLHLGGVGLLGGVAGFLLVWSSDYRWKRFVSFLDPWARRQDEGYQLVQSFLAFGNGGVIGVGPGNGRQKLFFLPEAHTDFIFALIGEELGLFGAIAVLVAFSILALRGFRIAARASESFTSLAAFGLTFCLVAQAALNVCVVTGLLPTKGLPLPLLSYGGSSLVVTAGMIALLLGLSREVR